jgi:hypothetical protein
MTKKDYELIAHKINNRWTSNFKDNLFKKLDDDEKYLFRIGFIECIIGLIDALSIDNNFDYIKFSNTVFKED